MTGIDEVDGRPVCASCRQPVDPRAFVCLNCGSALQPAGPVAARSGANDGAAPPTGPPAPLPPPAFRSAPPPPQGRPVFVAPPPPPAVPSQPPPPAGPWTAGPAVPGSGAGVTGTNPTDSFTIHIPLPVERPPVAPAPVPAAPEPPEGPDSGDERTVVVERRPKAEWTLRLASGERVPVDRTLLMGRNPAAAAGPEGARLVVIADPGRTVSRSHIVVEPRPGAGIVVRDVSSANGILLVVDGVESEVEANGEVRIAGRCTIVLGRYRIEVEPA